jgi:polyisoprenoid-binding protein YceI
MTVAATSIDTRNTRRDTHLRSTDFFDSDRSPNITFTADSIRPAGGHQVAVEGTLAVRDRNLPMSFDATASGGPDGEIVLEAQVRVNRADLGLTWNLMGMAGMINTITIQAVFTRR